MVLKCHSLQITDMFSSITESGQFMVDEALVAVTRGDSYIEVEFEEGGMYNDTLKCYSEDLSSSVRLHIIAGLWGMGSLIPRLSP